MVLGNIKNDLRVAIRDDVERVVDLIEFSIPVHSKKSHVYEPSDHTPGRRFEWLKLRCC